MNAVLRNTIVSLSLLLPAAGFAGGSVSGKVDAQPAKYLEETVVFIKDAKAPAAAKTEAMDQKGMKFVPHVVAVTEGDSVEFLNHDNVDHNVFSPDGETFNLGMIKFNGKGTYQFKKAGAYSQLCSVHPEMLGFVYVAPSPYHAVVDAKGNFKIANVPPGTYTLAVWNSHLKGAEQSITVTDGKATEVTLAVKR